MIINGTSSAKSIFPVHNLWTGNFLYSIHILSTEVCNVAVDAGQSAFKNGRNGHPSSYYARMASQDQGTNVFCRVNDATQVMIDLINSSEYILIKSVHGSNIKDYMTAKRMRSGLAHINGLLFLYFLLLSIN